MFFVLSKPDIFWLQIQSKKFVILSQFSKLQHVYKNNNCENTDLSFFLSTQVTGRIFSDWSDCFNVALHSTLSPENQFNN